MKDVIYLIFYLLNIVAKLLRPGGSKTIIAENLLLKQQLIIHSRARQRATNLSAKDRALLGFWSLFLNPRRIARSAIIIKPSTLLRFHNALKKQKYRLLYSPGGGRKPGPKGPSKEIIDAIVSMKQRNPRFGCPRIAQQINLAFGLDLDKDTVRRVLATHYLCMANSQFTQRIKALTQPDALDEHVARLPTPIPSTPSPSSSTPGSSGVIGVSFYRPPTPILFPPPATYLPANSEGVSYSARSGQTPSATSYQLLAPEWQSVEDFAQGYYLAHGLANMLTSRHWQAERKFTGDYPG
jgi:hypothetical protein